MKKLFLSLIAITAMFSMSAQSTQSVKENVETTAKSVTEIMRQAPSSTKYGIVGVTQTTYIVNTPVGQYNVQRNPDGSATFLGITAKLVAKNGSKYTISSSIGTYVIDTKRMTVTKL